MVSSARVADVPVASTGFLLPQAPVTSLAAYRTGGGGQALDKAHRVGPDAVVEELTTAKLRGRGGGGFLTGRKWASLRRSGGGTHYVVCNAAEGEPATFKDRALMRANPYQAVEGIAIAAFCVDAPAAYIVTKGSFERERQALTRAVQEMDAAGLLGDLEVSIVAGPDEYLLGEEKALLEVVEGKEPLPRLYPPFEHGLFSTGPAQGWQATTATSSIGPQSNPTLVNNLETLCNVPHIVRRGAGWFRSLGTPATPGTLCCTIVGDVRHPAVLEVEMGTPLSEVIERCGGPLPGRTLKAAFSGVANPVLTADKLGTPLSHEHMKAAGTGLGAGGFAVYDDTACMVEVTRAFSRFLYVESCGQCRSCKFGCGEITRALERINEGQGEDGDVDEIAKRLRTITDSVRCFLPQEEQALVASMLRAFPEEFADHLEGRCRVAQRHIIVPKVVDMTDDGVIYDEKQDRKQPDWTYAQA
jgi:NADH-quinone oxidoreductase subunit F